MVFKAKLIQDEAYYRLRRRQLVLSLLPGIPLGAAMSSIYQWPIWATLLAAAVYILAVAALIWNRYKAHAAAGPLYIEVDADEIRLKPREKTQQAEVIRLEGLKRIALCRGHDIVNEEANNPWNEVRGAPLMNYFILEGEGDVRRLNFEMTSHYMSVQLDKILDLWRQRGLQIETIQPGIKQKAQGVYSSPSHDL